ncbi:unnamed protein product [Discosporangium mesarthrocarpum]
MPIIILSKDVGDRFLVKDYMGTAGANPVSEEKISLFMFVPLSLVGKRNGHSNVYDQEPPRLTTCASVPTHTVFLSLCTSHDPLSAKVCINLLFPPKTCLGS